MGFALTSLGLLVLVIVIAIYDSVYLHDKNDKNYHKRL